MSAKFVPISWTPFKKKYDLILWGFNAIYLIGFFLLNTYLHPNLNTNTIIIRGLGTLAILLLHFILWIGPASRFNNKLLPLLYNRRHLGVSMFLVAAGHGILSLLWFHGGGNTDIFTSLFTSNLHYNSLIYFPFQTLGFIALLIFAIMIYKINSHRKKLNFDLAQKNAEIEEKQKEIIDSIIYAKRIQTALLPSDSFVDRILNKLNDKG
jgi:DMSO/TMAO reductase YedYZ heme-binding membrane subunit